ncbi:hypothetical protein H0H93_000269, partial [Arthromyces matolae]
HAQEPTTYSLTGTVVDRGESHQYPSLPSGITSTTVVSSPVGASFNGVQDAEKVTTTQKLPPVIPTEHSGRTLVVCFDGTGDQFDADNSNIVQLVSLLKKNDREKQMVYYQ